MSDTCIDISDLQIKKKFQARQRAESFQRFKNNRGQMTLSHKRQHVWGGQSDENFSKRAVRLGPDDALDIITKENLTHDTTILWHTQGKSVKTALRMGQLNPQALTAKAIKALGKYNKKIADRAIKSRIESHLTPHKKILLASAQDSIELLQKLERCLGQRVHSGSARHFAAAVNDCLDDYIGIAEKQINEVDQHASEGSNSPICLLPSKLRGAYVRSLKALNQENILAAQKLQSCLLMSEHQGRAEWLQTTGNKEMLSFLKERILATVRQMQALNQALTHQQGSGAYLRGDLNSAAEDAIAIVREHTQDVHNPVTEDHQLSYPPDKDVVVDSDFHTDGSLEQLDDLMLAVSQISGNNYEDDLTQEKGGIDKTAAPKWRHWRSFYDNSNFYEPALFSSWRHVKGWLRNLFLSPLNLIETMLRGNDARYFASKRYVPPENQKVTKQTNYYALIYRIKKQTSISTKIGLELYKAFNYLLVEGLLKGLNDGWRQIKRLPENLLTDFQKQDLPEEKILIQLSQELKDIKKREKRVLGKRLAEEKAEKTVYYAQPQIELTPYRSHGLLNGGASGVIEFVNLFEHNMFAKHPFTAVMSSAAAALSFMAFYATPLVTQVFGKGYVKFLQDQGYIWGKDVFSASMAGSFTHFKLIGTIIEGLEHGPDSWLSKGISQILNDPAKAITYTALAWSIGYALVYLVEVPGLSEELRNHIGNPPQLSEIFGGAKMFIIAIHLFSNPYESTAEARKKYIDECVLNYIRSEKGRGRKFSAQEEEQEKNTMTQHLNQLISPEVIEKLRKQIEDAQKEPVTPQQAKLALLLHLALNREKLPQLTPLLRARLQHSLQQLTTCKEDATAIDKYIDPEKYAPKSTLRSFLGRTISYVPTLLRCVLSPITGSCACSWASMARPWKELAAMLLDDVTSTTYAVSRMVNKILEVLFNRLPRTVLDIVMNSMVARVVSFFGSHGFTLFGYRQSAKWDAAQERLYANTTGVVLNYLASKNTTPHPDKSISYASYELIREASGQSITLPALAAAVPGVAKTVQLPVVETNEISPALGNKAICI